MSGQPDIFGPYTLLGLIGVGPMGDVYRAMCPEGPLQGKVLALKRFHLPFSRDPGFRAAFFEGVEGAKGRSFPGVSPLLEAGEIDGVLYGVRPFLPGASLRQLLDHVKAVGGVISPSLAVGCVLQLAEAMKGIQGAGEGARVIHGCLKPENILMDAQGVSTILDYGTAGPLNWGASGLWWLDPQALPYLPPEILGEREPEQQFDVFSLGALLVECLTLSPPFQFSSPMEAIDSIRRLDLAPLRGRLEDQGFERELIDLIEWSLDPEAGRRLEDSGLFHTYLSEQLPGAGGGPGADVFWGELITELQGLEDEAPPPADGIWDLMLLDGHLPSGPLEDVGEGASPWVGAPKALTPSALSAATPSLPEGAGGSPPLGLVLGTLAAIKARGEAAHGGEDEANRPSPSLGGASVDSGVSPGVSSQELGAASGSVVEALGQGDVRESEPLTFNADEIAYDGADEIAYESGDDDDDDDDYDDEGYEGESLDESELAAEAVYSVGDGDGDIMMLSGEDGDESEDEDEYDDDEYEDESSDEDDDGPAVLAMGDGLELEAGSAFLDESESETEADAFEDAERAFFAGGAPDEGFEAEGVTLAVGAASPEDYDEDFEDDDEFEDDEFEDDDEDGGAGDVVVALGDSSPVVAALGGVLGVGERVDLSAILGEDDPAEGDGAPDDDAPMVLAVGEDGASIEAETIEGEVEAAFLGDESQGDNREEREPGDDEADDDEPSEEDMIGGIVEVSGGDPDAADLPEPVMLPAEDAPEAIPEEESPPEEAKVNFSDRQTVQMSKAQLESMLASGGVESLSQRQRAVLESLQSLDGEASPLGLSDIFSAFNRPKESEGAEALPQNPRDVEAISGDGEAARIEGLLSTSTRRRRSGALPEGTVLEGQLKIVRRIEVGPYRALYEAVAAPEALTRRCWECGYAHNTRDDRRCYRCRRPLGRRRFCVSARWDRRLVGYDLELIRGGVAHGAIDPIYGWLVHEGQLCRVMELRGDEFLAMMGQLTLTQAQGIALSLCDALTYLSSEGVSLRELLPSQVVVVEGGALLYDPEVGGVEGSPLRGAALSRAAELIGRLLVLLLPPGQSPLGDILSEATAGRFSSPEGLKGALVALEERGRSAHGA